MKPLCSIALFVICLAAGSYDVRPRVELGHTATASSMDRSLPFYVDALPDAVVPPIDAAFGDTIEIRSVGIELSYDVKEIRATAGDTLTIRYDNSDSEMTHNFVLVRGEKDIIPVGNAALSAYRNDYIPTDEIDRIIAHSRLVYPGETDTFSFVVPPPGTYPYICTYSGHFTMMQGRLISIE